MSLLDSFKNTFLYCDKYKTHSEAVIIACYFNPQGNPYRKIAFNKFYESIKHLNHRIIECVIGDAEAELPENKYISRVHTSNLLWHKESLLNKIISELPKKFKYVFWLDTDVLFTNKKWLVESVESLKTNKILQPFEYCVHLEKDLYQPLFDVEKEKKFVGNPTTRHPKMWRSFCANHNTSKYISCDTNYDKHGHVGFAWGARREVLDEMPLYDKALIGGADHIMAHAAAGQIGHSCITKAFTDDIKAINDWSVLFYNVINGEIGYVKGELYHIWHGDLGKRQYLKRIQDFTSKAKTITERDENGLFITKNGDDEYVKQYFNHREDTTEETLVDDESKNKIREEVRKKQARNVLRQQYPDADNSFIESMIVGYLSDSTMLGTAIGGDLTGAIIGDMLNSNDDTDKYSGGDLSEHNEENFS
jgi:predicted small metal-binding protein